jgi:hypothetical protein
MPQRKIIKSTIHSFQQRSVHLGIGKTVDQKNMGLNPRRLTLLIDTIVLGISIQSSDGTTEQRESLMVSSSLLHFLAIARINPRRK